MKLILIFGLERCSPSLVAHAQFRRPNYFLLVGTDAGETCSATELFIFLFRPSLRLYYYSLRKVTEHRIHPQSPGVRIVILISRFFSVHFVSPQLWHAAFDLRLASIVRRESLCYLSVFYTKFWFCPDWPSGLSQRRSARRLAANSPRSTETIHEVISWKRSW